MSTRSRPIYTCEWCFGPLEATYDYEAIAALDLARVDRGRPGVDLALRRRCCRSTAPAGGALAAGWTPLVRAERLAAELGLGEVWLKDDTRNPTNSFKDRVVAVALGKALDFGFKTAACASTGNLANAVAAAAARTGLASFVFVPSDLEAGEDPHHRRCTAATSSRSTATTTT